MKKKIAISVGCLVLAGLLGCAYAPDDDSYEFGYPIRESPRYALVPNTRWTGLHYSIDNVFGPTSDLWIFLDSHRILFTRRPLGAERPTVNHDHVATADEWRWIAGQLEKAEVARWKKSYEPDGVEIFDGVGWTLEFLDGTNVVGKADGDNAWPKNFKDFQAILDVFGVEWRGSCFVSPKAAEEKDTEHR